jgi:hypothetical protein
LRLRHDAGVRGHFLIVAGMALALAGRAEAADQSPICADRPGRSSQPCTVPAGHFQIESSIADWTLDRNDGERDTALSLGQMDFKYGLDDRTHVDIGIAPWNRATSRAGGVHDRASGFGDVLAMVKHNVSPTTSALQVAVSPFVKIPTAKRPLGNGRWEGGFIVPIVYTIGKSPFTINTTPEIDWAADGDGDGHHLAMVQVANIGWQVTPKLNVSGEIWGQWDWDPAGTTRQASADGAIAYLVHNDLQLDAGFNIGLNRATPDLEVYAGIAKQF